MVILEESTLGTVQNAVSRAAGEIYEITVFYLLYISQYWGWVERD